MSNDVKFFEIPCIKKLTPTPNFNFSMPKNNSDPDLDSTLNV